MGWRENAAEYKRKYYLAHKQEFSKRSTEWWNDNRERANALRHLLRLRKKTNPTHANVRKMIELAAKFPKKRIVYR